MVIGDLQERLFYGLSIDDENKSLRQLTLSMIYLVICKLKKTLLILLYCNNMWAIYTYMFSNYVIKFI